MAITMDRVVGNGVKFYKMVFCEDGEEKPIYLCAESREVMEKALGFNGWLMICGHSACGYSSTLMTRAVRNSGIGIKVGRNGKPIYDESEKRRVAEECFEVAEMR